MYRGGFLDRPKEKRLWKCDIQQRKRACSWSRTTINNVSGGVCHTHSSFGDTNYTSSSATPGRHRHSEQLQHSSPVQWSLPPICSSATTTDRQKLSRSKPSEVRNMANVKEVTWLFLQKKAPKIRFHWIHLLLLHAIMKNRFTPVICATVVGQYRSDKLGLSERERDHFLFTFLLFTNSWSYCLMIHQTKHTVW